MLTQERLAAVTSSSCDLSLVLFDEIEKAAPSLTVLLLGILDRGTLTLGDNTVVNFERSFIFLTSNLGAREMMKEMKPDFGFAPAITARRSELAGKLESIGLAAVRRRFSPEFVNRIDVVITYQPLDQSRWRRSSTITSKSCSATSTRASAIARSRLRSPRPPGSCCSNGDQSRSTARAS